MTFIDKLRETAQARLTQRAIDVPWTPKTALLVCEVLEAACSGPVSLKLQECLDRLRSHVEGGGE
jgi:hypothetical protein